MNSHDTGTTLARTVGDLWGLWIDLEAGREAHFICPLDGRACRLLSDDFIENFEDIQANAGLRGDVRTAILLHRKLAIAGDAEKDAAPT